MTSQDSVPGPIYKHLNIPYSVLRFSYDSFHNIMSLFISFDHGSGDIFCKRRLNTHELTVPK